MAEVSSTAAKVCAACAKDVSALPRTKDAQGRYFCKTCVEKLKTKTAQAAKPVEQDAVMSKLLADSPGVELCPNCGGGVQANAKICIRCGFNKETGKAMRVQVERARETKEPRAGRRAGSYLITEGMYLGLLCLLVGGGFAASMFNPVFGILLYAICSILFLVAWIWGIIAAFQDDESFYGICGIAGFVFGVSWLLFIYYALIVTTRGYLKMTMAAALLGIVAGAVGMFGHLADEEELPKSRQRIQAPAGNNSDGSEQPAPAPSDGTVLGG